MKVVLQLLLVCIWAGGLFSSSLHAQQRKYTYFSIGGSIGTTHYQGDLDNSGFEPWRDNSPGFSFKTLRPNFGIQLAYHFNPHMYVRIGYNLGWINGADSLSSDSTRKARNLHFRSVVHDFSAQIVYEFFATDRHYQYRPKWSPYVFTGISVFHFNPQAQPNKEWVAQYPYMFGSDKEQWVNLKPLGTEGQTLPTGLRNQNELPEPYSLTQIAIPIGIGVRYMLSRKLDLRVELTLRKTFTDYLDDVSGPRYAPPEDLVRYASEKSFLFADRSAAAGFGVDRKGFDFKPYPRGETKAQEIARYNGNWGIDGVNRGNSNDQDWYGFFTVGVSYILDKGARCPRFKKP